MDPIPPEPAVDGSASTDDPLVRDWAPTVSNPQWQAMLEGNGEAFASGRRFLRHIPSSPRCKLCAAPFAGLGAPVMRMMNRGPWDKNPSICGFCFKELERGRGGAEIELTLLFADIRGSTALGESMGAASFHALLDRFYHEMTKLLVAHDAVVDKFVGDEVVALFIPVLAGAGHADRAVACGARDAQGHRPRRPGGPVGPVGDRDPHGPGLGRHGR